MEEPQCWNCIFWRTPLFATRAKCVCVDSPHYNQHTSMCSTCECFAHHEEEKSEHENDRAA